MPTLTSIADTLIRVAVCGLGVGALVRVLTITWKHVLNITVSLREQADLAAAVCGFLAGFRFVRDYGLAAKMAVMVAGGYFAMKWLTQALGGLSA